MQLLIRLAKEACLPGVFSDRSYLQIFDFPKAGEIF